MALTRLVSAVAATCIAAGATVGIAGAATALPASDPDTFATQARNAAIAADVAFVDARWSDVLAAAAAFDEAYAALVAAQASATADAVAAQTAYEEARAAYEAALAERDAVRDDLDAARLARDEAKDAKDAARDALAAAEAALAASPAAIAAAEDDVADAAAAAALAQDDVDAAQSDHDAANAAFNASIASVIGAPSWWTDLNTRPVKVSDINGAIEDTESQIPGLETAVSNAQTELANAQGIFARLAAAARLATAVANLARAQAALVVLNRAYDEVDGAQREQAVEDTALALENAKADRDAANGDLAAAQQTLQELQDAVPGLEADVAAALAAFEQARQDLDNARDALELARQAHDAIRVTLAEKESIADDAAFNAMLLSYKAAEINALVEGLADAVQSVADRRADLADFEEVKRVVVWTVGADNETPRAGDTVKLNFTVPNSELYDLSGAQVRVVSPEGVTASCDIVGGVVEAGATVTCSATYVTTAADAEAGEVVFEVELTGYLPLGPGNPRSQAVNRTLLTVTESIAVPVAAGLVADAGDDEALADTGANLAPGVLAATLIIAGGALLVARRRFGAAV